MPVKPDYPGVYIEEVPSGVRTITGVATSITAFVGRAVRGPLHRPMRVHGFEDYGRTFGGLSHDSTVSYAVQHFFANGGTEAIVVRCYRVPSTTQVTEGAAIDGVATLRLPAWFVEAQGTLTLAVNPADDDTMTIGDRTYTFVQVEEDEELTDTPGNLVIGRTVAATRANVVAAINRTEGAGTRYAPSTTAHPAVYAARSFVGSTLVLTARSGGPEANTIQTTSDFDDEANGFDADTFGGTRPGAEPSAESTAAEGTLSILGSNVTDDDRMTIGDRTYRFQDTLTDESGNIQIGTGVGDTRRNIVAAINGTDAGEGWYAASTDPHPDVTARLDGNEIVLTARTPGTAGNAIRTTGSFEDEDHGFAAETLAGGEDAPSITLAAADPGAWGNTLRVTIGHEVADPSDTTTFNLVVAEVDPSLPPSAPAIRSEEFLNVSVDPASPRHVDRVLESRSNLVRVQTTSEDVPGAVALEALSGGSDGRPLTDAEISGDDLASRKQGLWALENADLFNLLCVPPLSFEPDDDIGPVTRDAALQYCKQRRAFFILDPPSDWVSVEDAEIGVDSLAMRDENVAVYFPRVRMADPLREGQLATFAPSGAIAGVYARTDARRGVWKAPAGIEATITGVRELELKLTDRENGVLNPLGVSCLRTFPVIGPVVWGARTMRGADQLASEWKYVPVRRMALFIQESLYRGLQWVVFEPNDEPLWAQIRLNVGSFLHTQFRKGAFQGATPQEGYLVKCDGETTTQADIDAGIVNILVGFAPLKPAEFVFVRIQQLAGQDLT